MRLNDCVRAKECNCDCQHCSAYQSNKPKDRMVLIQFYVGEYFNNDNNADEKEEIKEIAKGFLTSAEYIVFQNEIGMGV